MNFVESTDCQQSPQPYFFEAVSVTGCTLRADPARLQNWCDRFLNIGSNHYFRPLLSDVWACFSHYPKMFCEGEEELGYTCQNEYFFMFPVVRYINVGQFLIPIELSWAFPFIGVTNGTSAISGQAVLGYPKMVGTIAIDTASDGAVTAAAAMPGFIRFGRDMEQQVLPVAAIATGPTILGGTTVPQVFPWSLVTSGLVAGTIEDAIIELLEAIDPGLFSVTILKQIRDAENSGQACFQSLVRAEWSLTTATSTLLDGAAVDIFDNASVAIAATLGLTGGVPIPAMPAGTPAAAPSTQAPSPSAGQRFTALGAFAMQTDMRFGNITNIGL